MFKRLLGLIPFAVLLAACGSGGDDHTPTAGDGGPVTPTGPTIGSVTLQTSSPQIASNGSASADITAFVRDVNNKFIESVDVSFATSSGGISVTQAITDTGGIARATLSPAGDPTNRTITVTATAGTQSGSVTVDVSGTQLSVSGPASLAQNDVGTYTVSLRDSGGSGISGRAITVNSSRSNTLSATSLTTSASGQATFTLTAVNGGTDTITATGLGLTATQSTAISVDQFAFSAPATNAEIPLNTAQTVTVRWTQAGVPQVGQTINFASTRGTLSVASAVTNVAGDATVNVQSANAGFGVLSATTTTLGGITTERTVEFVATAPAAIDLQASPFTIATQEKSIITAVVRDANGNLVKNRVVQFSLQDVTGGQLSVASASTDSQGRAQSTYTASASTSAANGVAVTGTVLGSGIADTALITVARREVFISLGTGNEIEEPNEAQYSIVYAIQVTDSSGNGVADTPLTLDVLSTTYAHGIRTFPDTRWVTSPTAICRDEDLNNNGILDVGEDVNGSTRIEAGNIATVIRHVETTGTPTTGPITTDANGFALVDVVYPQEYAEWVEVRLSASTAVQGTEFVRSVDFLLPGAASDFNSEATAPPGGTSPFGALAQPCVSP